jgi:hypothetical protein
MAATAAAEAPSEPSPVPAGHLTAPGQSYNSAKLQLQFQGPRDAYTTLCKRGGLHVITAVEKMLPAGSGAWEVTDLDLSRTYVGHRGVVPIMELCKLLHKLTTLNLSNNYLNNKSVYWICKAAAFHPSLQSIDLSHNEVTWTAGMCALELVVRNPTIQRIDLANTLVKPKVIQTIAAQIKRNMYTGARQHRHGPNATNHPVTIRQRALKRFFRSALAKEGSPRNSRVSKMYLVEGCKESMRLAGRDAEIPHKSPAFFDSYVQRAGAADTVDWEMFSVLVMLDEATYDAAVVEHLRGVFAQFDPDGSGYVELSDMEELMAQAYHITPSAVEVAAKMAFFAADGTMTVTWDEFLLLMYDHGPVIGELSTFTTHTPLKRSKATHH